MFHKKYNPGTRLLILTGVRDTIFTRHFGNKTIFMLNKNNQEVAISYISQINDIILDAQEYIDGINNRVENIC